MSSRTLVMGTAVTPVNGQLIDQVLYSLAATAGATSASNILHTTTLTGTTLPEALAFPQKALEKVTKTVRSATQDTVLISGLRDCPARSFDVLGWNLEVASNVGAGVIAVIDATGMGQQLLEDEITTLRRRINDHHATLSAVLVAAGNGLTLPKIGLGDSAIPILSAPISDQELENIDRREPEIVTPIMFQVDLLARAGKDLKTIVLPEPTDERILRATDILLREKVADIVLVGDAFQINADASRMGLEISGARIVSPTNPRLVEKYAAEFARLRASKGMTLEEARFIVQNPTYFATMMVQMGDAHGMVSGAVHTTTDTIRPAFQIIKTAPGTSLVSSVFLMLMADKVLVMGDCAVNPNPNAAQLADIAITSAKTAEQFGVVPAVAMLSYSTGISGSGPDVDRVREATERVNEIAPYLPCGGPIQYDAAINPRVGAAKAPEMMVAGRATVLIFPDLDAGNIGYKAVQRSAKAVAVGPILQGLRRPVNDLSRGAMVEDIVNTVAITAVQAQDEANIDEELEILEKGA